MYKRFTLFLRVNLKGLETRWGVTTKLQSILRDRVVTQTLGLFGVPESSSSTYFHPVRFSERTSFWPWQNDWRCKISKRRNLAQWDVEGKDVTKVVIGKQNKRNEWNTLSVISVNRLWIVYNQLTYVLINTMNQWCTVHNTIHGLYFDTFLFIPESVMFQFSDHPFCLVVSLVVFYLRLNMYAIHDCVSSYAPRFSPIPSPETRPVVPVPHEGALWLRNWL